MRGHPRTPLDKAKATGRTSVNPARFKNRKEPQSVPLGDPPDELGLYECIMWNDFRREVPWLKESDRATVMVAAKLRAKLLTDDATDRDIGKLLSCLSRMGATPADRSRIYAPKEDTDESSEFLQ
jgi:hypothetical protein